MVIDAGINVTGTFKWAHQCGDWSVVPQLLLRDPVKLRNPVKEKQFPNTFRYYMVIIPPASAADSSKLVNEKDKTKQQLLLWQIKVVDEAVARLQRSMDGVPGQRGWWKYIVLRSDAKDETDRMRKLMNTKDENTYAWHHVIFRKKNTNEFGQSHDDWMFADPNNLIIADPTSTADQSLSSPFPFVLDLSTLFDAHKSCRSETNVHTTCTATNHPPPAGTLPCCTGLRACVCFVRWCQPRPSMLALLLFRSTKASAHVCSLLSLVRFCRYTLWHITANSKLYPSTQVCLLHVRGKRKFRGGICDQRSPQPRKRLTGASY